MIRVMVVCPAPDDATSFYRGVFPLALLQSQMPDLSLIYVNEVKASTVRMCDIVFMQRPFAAQHLAAARIVKSCRTPLWVDYDDDLLAVPPDNPTFTIYGKESTQKQVARIIAMADIMSVSTPHLGLKFKPLNPNIVVIPNALDDTIFTPREPRRVPRPKLVLWRGGGTHHKDLSTVGTQLIEASHDPDRADWLFQFHGFNPWWITERMRERQTICSEGIPILEYRDFLHALHPALMIVPLVPSEFNLSKSNCSWIEGVFAGAAVIAPDIPEFQQPGIIRYSGPEDFGVKLKEAMTGGYDLTAMNELSWNHIKTNLRLTRVNHLRRQIVQTLHGQPKPSLD